MAFYTKQDFLTISLACHTISLALLVCIDGRITFIFDVRVMSTRQPQFEIGIEGCYIIAKMPARGQNDRQK